MSTELALPSQLKTDLEARSHEIAQLLPDNMSHERFIRTALIAVTKNPDIQACTRQSVLIALLECGRLGLMPDGREAAIIKYRQTAELMPMVQGIIRLILRSAGVLKVEARAVREGDEFGYQYGLHPDLVHTPKAPDTAGVTHAYAVVWREATEPTFEVVDRETIEAARLMSKAPNSPAWRGWYSEMARKVALKRLSKYLDLSPEASRAIAFDNYAYGSPEEWDYGVEGPSDEYRNLLVKSRTEEGIKGLKDKLEEAAAEEDEDKDEPTPAGAERPWPPQTVRKKFNITVDNLTGEGLRKDQIKRGSMDLIQFVAWQLEECFAGDPHARDKRYSVLGYMSEGKSASLKDDFWTGARLVALEKWLDPTEKKGEFSPNAVSAKEARLIAKERMMEKGQNELPLEERE